MRFRRLSLDELENLKDHFVRFLAVMGVDAQEWERIKANDGERADALIDEFSDLVMLQSLKNVKTLENKTKNSWIMMRYTESWSLVINIESKNWQETNLLELDWQEVFTNEKHLKNIEFQHARKVYKPLEREDEIFRQLATGGVWLGDDLIFDVLWDTFGLEKHYQLN
jgi:hypothetical protein